MRLLLCLDCWIRLTERGGKSSDKSVIPKYYIVSPGRPLLEIMRMYSKYYDNAKLATPYINIRTAERNSSSQNTFHRTGV